MDDTTETTPRAPGDSPVTAVRADAPRPWVKAGRLTGGRSVGCLTVLAGVVVLLTLADMDARVSLLVGMAAFLPLPLYVALALWLDRYEPEPRRMLITAFLWGASVAVLIAGLVNGLADSTFGEAVGTVITGPIVEEAVKAFILFRFYVKRPDEFDGVIDGLIYAAMVGLGFAAVENLEYYGRSFAKEGMSGLAVTFTLRGIMSPFSHPLFTSMTGFGLGLARQTNRPWVRRVAPAVGLSAAIGLHALWNAGASLGCVFFGIYLFVMVPALVMVLVFAISAWRGEGRLIMAQLAAEAASGTVAVDEYQRLCTVRGRLSASWQAFSQGGRTGWRARRARHRAAAELAFLRHRVARGLQPPDPDLEAVYLAALAPNTMTGDSSAPGPETTTES